MARTVSRTGRACLADRRWRTTAPEGQGPSSLRVPGPPCPLLPVLCAALFLLHTGVHGRGEHSLSVCVVSPPPTQAPLRKFQGRFRLPDPRASRWPRGLCVVVGDSSTGTATGGVGSSSPKAEQVLLARPAPQAGSGGARVSAQAAPTLKLVLIVTKQHASLITDTVSFLRGQRSPPTPRSCRRPRVHSLWRRTGWLTDVLGREAGEEERADGLSGLVSTGS